MKYLLYLVTIATLLLATCGRNPSSTTGKAATIPQREGIQWGEFIHGDPDIWGNVDVFRIPYRTTDGTADTLLYDFGLPVNPDIIEIQEEDINFDGIPDAQIRVGYHDVYFDWEGQKVHYCTQYNYIGYIWNPTEGRFDLVKNYESIYGPEIYKDSLCIWGTDYFDFDDSIVIIRNKWQWVDGNLMITDSFEE